VITRFCGTPICPFAWTPVSDVDVAADARGAANKARPLTARAEADVNAVARPTAVRMRDVDVNCAP
jgi:hypothetical protein